MNSNIEIRKRKKKELCFFLSQIFHLFNFELITMCMLDFEIFCFLRYYHNEYFEVFKRKTKNQQKKREKTFI